MLRVQFSVALIGCCVLAAPSCAANPPANICTEVVAWMDELQAKAAAPGAPGQQSQPQGAQSRTEDAKRPETSTAVEQGGRGAVRQPGGQDEPQMTSGLSGPVTANGPGAAGPQGAAQETAKSGSVNPKPDADQQKSATAKPVEPKAPAPSQYAVEKARLSAGAADLDGCAAAVRDMRLAGVALPAPLIALAALKPELRRTMAPRGPAPGLPAIPPSGIAPDAAGGAPSGAGATAPAR